MLIVINHHYIRESYKKKPTGIFGVTPQTFEKQLDSLSKIGDFINPDNLLDQEEKISEKNSLSFLITFDDGLKEQIIFACPILIKKGIPAAFFINPTNQIEKKLSCIHQQHIIRDRINNSALERHFKKYFGKVSLTENEKLSARKKYIYDKENVANLKYFLNFIISHDECSNVINEIFNEIIGDGNDNNSSRLYFSIEDIKYLSKIFFIGSHSYNHIPLGLLNGKQIKDEIKNSIEAIENFTGEKPISFSYPFGDKRSIGVKAIDEISKQNIKWGLSMERAINTNLKNPLSISRFSYSDLFVGNTLKYSKHQILSSLPQRAWFN